MILVELFLTLPFFIRVAICLLLICSLWKFLSKGLLWVLSVIPYVLSIIFILLYQIIEFPIAILHKRFGRRFYKIDNLIAGFGESIDSGIKFWYNRWHYTYEAVWKKVIIVYFVCLFFITLPSFISTENKILKIGETLYVFCENSCIEWLDSHNIVTPKQDIIEDNRQEAEDEKTQDFEMELIVHGVNSALLVRDIPNMEKGVELERLYNGDRVVWMGELVFAEVENSRIEAWVKVLTKSGENGWSRLNYLYPEENQERSLYVITDQRD